jgi:hypothetical protein
MQEVLPKASKANREMASEPIQATLSAVGKQFSESPRTPPEIEGYAEAMADMFCAYVTAFEHSVSPPNISGKVRKSALSRGCSTTS